VLTLLFFSQTPGVRVEHVWRDGTTLHLEVAATRRWARCPVCQRRSKHLHSRYERTLADLPCGGERVVLHLHVRRFRCRVRGCPRQIFAERLPDLVAPFARRTVRLTTHLLRTAFALGGDPGARHIAEEGTSVSARTLLRLIRSAPVPAPGPVRVLGVDDWARRRGRTYGTLLVNLETHAVIDLLPDRTAASLAAWLRLHPELEIVSRDRAGAYADGIRMGAPQAAQVADRFHLQKNATDALERVLTRHHAALRQAAEPERGRAPMVDPVPAQEPPEALPMQPGAVAPQPPGQPDRRAWRLAAYEEVVRLQAQGASGRTIAARIGVSPRTVRAWLAVGHFPERRRRSERPSQLTPFAPYLHERRTQGRKNARQLWRELRERGFAGGYRSVAYYVRAWPGAAASDGRAATPRHVCWLLLKAPDKLTDSERSYLTRLEEICPPVAHAKALVQAFGAVLRGHDVAGLATWLREVETSGIKELQALGRSIGLDRSAVEAAVRLDWSNGQVEGQVTRLKLTKRAMYGRATFDLLRRRMLHAA
jgi:transposase